MSVLLLVFAVVGCAAGRVTFHDPNMDFALLQTVAVMPFGNLSADERGLIQTFRQLAADKREELLRYARFLDTETPREREGVES